MSGWLCMGQLNIQNANISEEEWPAIIDTATTEMVRFENAFKHWISILRVERILYHLCALFQ